MNNVKKEKTKEKKTKIITKWWFWIILLFITAIISFTIICLMGYQIIDNQSNGTFDLARKIQAIENNATIYSSSERKTLVLELDNWEMSEEKNNKYIEILTTIQKELKKEDYHTYDKFIVMTYLKSNEKEKAIFIKTDYKLPLFIQDENSEYIDFDEYNSLSNTYSNVINKMIDIYK